MTARAEDDSVKIKNLLVDQIFSTVRWRDSLINMSKNGVKIFVEIGPGKALIRHGQKNNKNVKLLFN